MAAADFDLGRQIAERAAQAGLPVSDQLSAELARYLMLLAKWNRTINLTSLSVDPPDDAAVDRLIVEPLLAAGAVKAADRTVIDIGSGGGSPALPLKLALPSCRFVLVEVKTRKAAFLREAARHLGLADVRVESCRLEDLPIPKTAADGADVATLRAVRLDEDLLQAIDGQLRPGGRLFWFRSADTAEVLPAGLEMLSEFGLGSRSPSRLIVARIRSKQP